MKRYAFIDVSNTKQTAREVFDFTIDWERLIVFLQNPKWQCEKVFYYEGESEGKKFENKRNRLAALGYDVKNKQTFFQKNKTRDIRFICKHCHEGNSFENYLFKCKKCGQESDIAFNNKGTHPKANFDVEITADALRHTASDVQIILFTGDGDFRYLAEKIIELGASVIFVSTYRETASDHRKRFSTRLKELVALEERKLTKLNVMPRVRFLEIDNFKHLIAKDENAKDENGRGMEKENAAKRDVSE